MGTTHPHTRRLRAVRAAVLCFFSALALAGCDRQAIDHGPSGTPMEAMARARVALDQTNGVRIELATDNLPDDVDGVIGATGIGTHPPAFDGAITITSGGATFEVPLVSVNDRVYAQIPLTTGWSDIDPADYGAPDPGTLMSAESGISSLLTSTRELTKGKSVRGGEDNSEVLTTYTGTVDGTQLSGIIPSATGSFEVAYTVTADSQLREMTMTGTFYPDSASMTYAIELTDYGIDKVVVAP
ncbi:MAG: LppX_LprAFG lipoprotein [Nocardioides sp.]